MCKVNLIAGGTLIIHIYQAGKGGELDDGPVMIHADGRIYQAEAGSAVVLNPGESVTLLPYQYHDFQVEPGSGDVLIG